MSHKNIPVHVRACLGAIDSIGGDPATVGELVAALRSIDTAFRVPDRKWVVGTAQAIIDARAVLAKLPENSND